MNTTTLIQDALSEGMNLELLLRETGIAHEDLIQNMEGRGFSFDESKLIRKVLKDWREGK